MPSALAAAAYVFNPLSFVLAYTFMTDPFFTALLLIATYGYVRGLRCDRPDHAALLFGAVAAACAFLVRQQGALIPTAIIVALLGQRRLHRDRESLRLVLRIVALPAIAIAGYYLWLVLIHGVPHEQTSFTHSVVSAGWEQSLLLDRPHDVCRSDVYRAVHPAGCLSRAQRGEPRRPGACASGLVHGALLGSHIAGGSDALQQR